MSTDFRRVKEIFLAAVEQNDPREREACLSQACGTDVELRQQVEALLRQQGQTGTSREQPVFQAAALLPSPPAESHDPDSCQETAGTYVGPYKLLQKIGEGGMGTVWMAEQQEPVRRMVAVKVMRAGLG